MRDDPNQIVGFLIEQHGVDGALATIRAEIEAAHTSQDNYRLSVWREVSMALRDRQSVEED